jgi:hypothetical protein
MSSSNTEADLDLRHEQLDRFSAELETAINPFVRDEISISEYLALLRSWDIEMDSKLGKPDPPAEDILPNLDNTCAKKESVPPQKKTCEDEVAFLSASLSKDDRFSLPVESLED